MKKFIFFLLLLSTGSVWAQESWLKAGAFLKLPVMVNPGPYGNIEELPAYPGIQLSYEKSFCSRWSFIINLEAEHSKSGTNDDGFKEEYVQTTMSLIPEFRFYLLKKQGLLPVQNQGLFLQAGLNVISYTCRSFQDFSAPINVKQSIDYYTLLFNDGYKGIPFGFGIKFPVAAMRGIEMNFNTDLIGLVNQERWQTFQIALKYYWMTGKARPKAQGQ